MLLKGRKRSIVWNTCSSRPTTVSSTNHRWTHLGLNPNCRGDWKCKNSPLMTHGRVDVELQEFLTAAVIGRDLAVSLSCSFTSAGKAGVTYWRSSYVGQRSKLDAAAKRKVAPTPAIDLRHPAHSLVAVLFIRAFGYCLMYILLPSVCKNGYCSKVRNWLIFTLRGLYHSITQVCKIPRCPVARPRIFEGSSNICGSSVRNFLHVIFVAPGILKTLPVFWKILAPLVFWFLCARPPACFYTDRAIKR